MIPRLATPLAAAVLMIAGLAVAASGADAIKARQQNMKALGGAMKVVGDQFRTGSPDMAVIKVQAAKVDAGAKALPTWFPAGSGPAPGLKTEALPTIWTNTAGFAAKQQALAQAAARFDAAAQAGDSAALLPAAKSVGAACGSCHDTFRVKKKA